MDVENWFDEVYREHMADMLRVARRILHNDQAAEDAVQNVFVTLLIKQESLRSHPNLPGWLYVTLRNVIGNELQKEKRRSHEVLELNLVPDNNDNLDRLEYMLPAALSQSDKDILIMFYEKQLSYNEIASQLGCSVLAARTRLFRAKERCSKKLGCNKELRVINKRLGGGGNNV